VSETRGAQLASMACGASFTGMDNLRRIAFAGLGIMGAPMAANLVRAGLEVVVYTRTREKAERFAAEHDGARAAATPADAAGEADAFVSIVPDAPQVEEILFGDAGAAAALPDGALVLEMSTISPTASRAIAEWLAPRAYVEAPVSGSRPKAEDGTLTIMAGASPEDFERARPLFEILGERIVHVGPVGHGQMAKLLTNTMGAVNAAALAEVVLTAKAAGLDRDAFLEVAGGSAGASAMLALKGPPMFEERYEPALFKLEHMLKDVRHCLAEARALGIELRLGALAETLYARAAEAGHGEHDFAAVFTAVKAGDSS
jgi:3-hydroxyisobutyrate dehydrogenase-like beta-hydroxyacid dehydrogenase